MDNKKIIYGIVGLNVLIAIISIFCLCQIYSVKEHVSSQIMIASDKIDKFNIDTSGKITDLDENIRKISDQQTVHVVEHTTEYVEKEDKEDADVEIKTKPAAVSVKVNDGDPYRFELLPTETTKFENGKLVIDSLYSTQFQISAPEYKRSKLSVFGAVNSKKDVIGGISYDITKDISAIAIVGQEIDPYAGLSFRVGGFK